jgi:hypothetical protein
MREKYFRRIKHLLSTKNKMKDKNREIDGGLSKTWFYSAVKLIGFTNPKIQTSKCISPMNIIFQKEKQNT